MAAGHIDGPFTAQRLWNALIVASPLVMWKEIIAGLDPLYTFNSPATVEVIANSEKILKVRFPGELTSLYIECNGVRGGYGIEVLWAVEDVRDRNLAQRQEIHLYCEPFDTLLFFADAGNGDQFAYRIADGRIVDTTIWVWDHEDDSRRVWATSLREFLELWLSGAKGV